MTSCPGSVCGKPKSFVDLSWSNRDSPVRILDYNHDQVCNTDPTVYVCGHTNTPNVGNIPMRGACSYPNTAGFFKKQREDTVGPERASEHRRPSNQNHLRISQTYLGDISPMFGAKTAWENVHGPIIRPVPVDASSVLVYPDGRAYPQHEYI